MARWTASAKWAAGPALDGQRDMPLALRLSEGLGPGAQEAAEGGMPALKLTPDRGALLCSQVAEPSIVESDDFNSA